MTGIIVASLVLIAIAFTFVSKRPDPKHEYMLGLYERMSYTADSQPDRAEPSDLARTA